MTDRILFYKSNEPHGYLNNYYRSRMYVFGHWWNNVEAPYQAMKCVKGDDFLKIWRAGTPKEARELGQIVQCVPGWEEIKVDVMEQCVMAKFTQDRDILEKLLLTLDAELIENSPIDSFWGCGADGQGQNNLGKVLMRTREKLKGF